MTNNFIFSEFEIIFRFKFAEILNFLLTTFLCAGGDDFSSVDDCIWGSQEDANNSRIMDAKFNIWRKKKIIVILIILVFFWLFYFYNTSDPSFFSMVAPFCIVTFKNVDNII